MNIINSAYLITQTLAILFIYKFESHCFKIPQNDNYIYILKRHFTPCNQLSLIKENANEVFNSSPPKKINLLEEDRILEGRFHKRLTQLPNIEQILNNNLTSYESSPKELEDDSGKDEENGDFNPVEYWHSLQKEYYKNQTEIFQDIDEQLIDKMGEDEIKRILRAKGYRTDGSLFFLRLRLKEKISKDISVKNSNGYTTKNLNNASSYNKKIDQEKLKTMAELVAVVSKPPKNDDTSFEIKNRWDNRIALSEIIDNPIGFFEKDLNSVQEGITEMNDETIFNQFQIPSEENSEILRDEIAEQIPKSFQIEEYPLQNNKIETLEQDITIEQLKRSYLSGYNHGIIDDSIEEFSRRFEVSIDFVADVLSKGGAKFPINSSDRIKDTISLDVIWDLIELISVSDPTEINEYYLTDPIETISKKYRISYDEICSVCSSLKLKLYFGPKTRLNQDCYQALISVLKSNKSTTNRGNILL